MVLSECLWRVKVFLGRGASRDDVITQFDHQENVFQSLMLVLSPFQRAWHRTSGPLSQRQSGRSSLGATEPGGAL